MSFPFKKSSGHKKFLTGCILLAAIIVLIVMGLFFILKNDKKAAHQTLKGGAVVANGPGCAEIGTKMLLKGGSAVDAAIATLLCEGVVVPQSMGLGGGFFGTLYIKKSGKVKTIIARETAPSKSHRDMFIDKPIIGAIAAATPGELLGYWRMHREYGKLKWSELFQPSIELCKNGHIVSSFLARVLRTTEQRILDEPSMREIFVNPETGKIWQEGDYVKRPELAETLEILASEGAGALYDGGIVGKRLIQDVQELGGILTEDDLKAYNVRWEEPIVANISNEFRLYTTTLPSSGPLLALILNIMNPLYSTNSSILWQRFIETFKHAFGLRTNLADPRFEPDSATFLKNITNEKFADDIRKLIFDDRTFTDYKYYGADFANADDHGTANVAVLAPNGDAVTITSTVNNYFGGKVRSRSTGIILNDEMDDFSTPGVINGFGIPASPANFIKPGKVPFSSMCPSIILDREGNVKLLVGGAGGSKITTSVAQMISRYLVFNESLDESIQARRLHHQLAPMVINYENGFDESVLTYLKSVGHSLEKLIIPSSFTALTAIGVESEKVQPIFDSRRPGSVSIV